MGDLRQTRTGIIGGSGLYDIDGIEVIDSLKLETPYGAPSDDLLLARYQGHDIVFLPRHGRGHVHLVVGGQDRGGRLIKSITGPTSMR